VSVSILIPAFRPTFLRECIASALNQSVQDFELLISDDSGGEEVLPVVEQFRDPRIRYTRTSGRIGARDNLARLWGEAKYPLIKYLFDDDLLMPDAILELVNCLRQEPAAAFSFGLRNRIDEQGRVIADAHPYSAPVITVNTEQMSRHLVGTVRNPIGEFSNVLMNAAAGLTPDDFLSYMGFDLHVLCDVGFYLNASTKGPAIGVSRLLGSFRSHAHQNSSPSFNPLFALGICEWELFVRGEYCVGRLPPSQAVHAAERLLRAYRDWSRGLPLIARMIPGLEALPDRIRSGDRNSFDNDFRLSWAELSAAAHRTAHAP
jgi:glycosyltransferase involved in cell wall biosynthesis